MREIRMIMEGSGYEITSLKDAGIKVDIDENGSTFEENALIKANALRPYTDGIILADDSGLEVDYLNKEPGVHSPDIWVRTHHMISKISLSLTVLMEWKGMTAVHALFV